MSNNYFVIDGKKITMSEETANKLKKQLSKKNTGWERVADGGFYYYVNSVGQVLDMQKREASFVDLCFEIANYYNDYEFACRVAHSQMIDRQLARFAAEHNESEIDWEFGQKYYIRFSERNKLLVIEDCFEFSCQATFFTSESIARAAIKEIGEDNIIWRLTEGMGIK